MILQIFKLQKGFPRSPPDKVEALVSEDDGDSVEDIDGVGDELFSFSWP